MIRAWRRWVAVIERTERGESLALFRIACGLCLLWSLGTVVLSDLVVVLWTAPAYGGYRPPSAANWLMHALGGPTPAVVWSIVVGTLLAGLCVVVGLGGRVAPLVAGQGFLALLRNNPEATGAYDTLLLNLLWLLVLSRSTATLSLDCRLRRGDWTRDVQVPAWPRYLVIFQLVVVYFSTGIHKASASWIPIGDWSALYYILQQPSWQRFDMSWVAHVYPLAQVGTLVTWSWEVSSPLLLLAFYYRANPSGRGRLCRFFNRFDLRKPFVAIGVTLHVLTLILMDVGPFTWISLAPYVCLWHPEEWRRFANRWRRRFGWGLASTV